MKKNWSRNEVILTVPVAVEKEKEGVKKKGGGKNW